MSNIFRYDLETKKVDAVSNTETGFFRPIPLGGDELIVFRYSGQGWVPTRITARPLEDVAPITFFAERMVEEHPVVKTWSVGSPMQIPYDDLPKKTGTYRLAGGLRTESLYPIIQGYKDTALVGVRWNLSDRLQLNRLNLSAGYSPDTSLPSDERVHLAAKYERFDWRVEAALNPGDFYDLFGPTKTGRKGYHGLIGHTSTLLYDDPKRLELDLNASGAANIDRLPDYQNVSVDVDRYYSFQAALRFSDLRHSLGHVDDEAGRRWSTTFDAQLVDGELVPQFRGTYDVGLPLPVGHSSVWLRNAAGYSTRDRNDPFANFFFGGFGNNYVDHRDEKRYREDYAFPGAEINELSGRNYVKSIVEWNLPPWRFRRAGTPGFYATWLRPALFVGGLMSDVDAAAYRRTYGTIGGQFDVRLSLLSALDLTVSVGGAVAVEDGSRPRKEAMVSLKILR